MATESEVRAALEWETDSRQPAEKNTWEWLWEAVQGDFNDKRSTGQIAFDAAISMIPVVDQICDVRDIYANCRNIAQSEEKDDNTWKWVALALTLIGLFPSLGSLVKGVLKILFTFVRRMGLDHVIKAVDKGMTWVITYLRKREVQKYLRELHWDEVFKELAKAAREVQAKVNAKALLAAFDRGIGIMKDLLGKVTWLPKIGERAKQAIATVEKIRKQADAPIAKAVEPLQKILDAIIHRLDKEHLLQRSGILDASSVHFRGTLPEASAVSLMRRRKPKWLKKGKGDFPPLEQARKQGTIDTAVKDGYPDLKHVDTFNTLEKHIVRGPAKLYRIASPSSAAASHSWISQEVYDQIQRLPLEERKAFWRANLAVWPDWNSNGQFFVYEVKHGEELKVWRGKASSQTKDAKNLDDFCLNGGTEQIDTLKRISLCVCCKRRIKHIEREIWMRPYISAIFTQPNDKIKI